jgi:hypothetical protein
MLWRVAYRKRSKPDALIGIAAAPVQVRNSDAKGVETRSMPFMSPALPVAGFAVIEAADLTEAINLASASLCAVAHGVWRFGPCRILRAHRLREFRAKGPGPRHVGG